MLPAVVGCVALLAWHAASRAALDDGRQALLVELLSKAAADVERGDVNLAGWQAAAELSLDEDGQAVVLASGGRPIDLLLDAPPFELSQAVNQATIWQDGQLRAATLMRDSSGQPRSLLYLERPALQQAGWLPVLVGAGACLLAGMAMAWYLSRRIYRPIDVIHQEAERALSGEASAVDISASPETSAFASSVCDLARMVRSSRSADQSSAPDSSEETPGAYPSKRPG